MNLKRVLGGLCGIAVALTMFGTAVGPKAPFIEEPISFTKVGSKANVHTNGIEIKYTGNKEIPPAEFKADYSEVNYKSLRGEEAKLGISDGSIYLQADEGVSIELAVIEYYTGSTVFREEGKKMISVECGSDMKANVAYYVEVTIHFVANEFFDDALILSVNERGQLYFVESPVYKYNVEQFSYLKDSSSYTKLCLLPEKDMESDNYDVKLFADTICKDARTDYEKIDKIYSFIVDEMYYDYDQAYYDSRTPYQDDALSLLRRKIAVCEGFSNVFVALCRAEGIPATETYGSGFGYDEMWALNMANVTSPNHAWVAVFVDGQWLIMDPTWDNMNEFIDGKATAHESTRNYVFIPMESFSFTHIYFDADITHSIKSSGECGPNATYEVDSNGVCTIYGYGTLCLPDNVNDFSMLVFDEDSDITAIDEAGIINCDLLNYVILPEGLEEIGDYAFYHCENLEYVYIPDTVSSIGHNAFWVCDKLSYIEIPDDTRVGYSCFDLCPRLILSVDDEDQVDTSNYVVSVAKIIVRD